jgi:hypothetical protein
MPSGYGDTIPQQRKKIRLEQVEWLLENYTEPEYMPDTTNNMSTLSTTFDVGNNVDLEGYNPCGITMAILNYRTTWNNKTQDLTYYSAAAFMRNIQCYLPVKLRTKDNPWNPINFQGERFENDGAEDTKQTLDKLIAMLQMMKARIENDCTCKYMLGGKPQFLEVLKRRYKDNWSEKMETVNENHDTIDGGLSIEVEFVDA